MAGAAMLPGLQATVERFGRSLVLPTKLLELHPRKNGNPGRHAALSPAILLGVLSAFEGFAEDFTASALYLNGDSFGQIARKVGRWNNPTVREFANVMSAEFPAVRQTLGVGFQAAVYRNPDAHTKVGFQNTRWLTWHDLLEDADAWMQVRHSLTHGQATGWGSERWPASIQRNAASPTSVLRARANGNHSLALHGSLSCARIYVQGARHIADTVAATLGNTLDWASVFLFDV